jgi:hypothetical protein
VSVDYAEIARLARLARLGRRAERRGKAFQGCITALLNKLATDLTTGWMLMLAVGVAHAEWLPMLPTIGYWWAVLLVVLTRPLFAATPPKRKEDAQ